MNTARKMISCWLPLWSLFFFTSLVTISAADADVLRLRAILVWGTNSDQAVDAKYKPVAPGLKRKLTGVFKWQNYFEVNRKNLVVPLKQEKRARMSPKCVIKVKNLGKAASKNPQKTVAATKIQVKLFGENNPVPVINRTQPIAPGGTITLCGKDKDDTAWFVVLTALPVKPAKAVTKK